MSCVRHSRLIPMLLCGALLLAGPVARARVVPGANDVVLLARDVERAEAIRDVKAVQIAYVQYSQFGLWSAAASLFAADGEAVYGKDDIKGATAIVHYMEQKFGGGNEGLPLGALHTLFDVTPVVTLSNDRRTAKARWHEISLLGTFGKNAEWRGGILENDYVKEDGVWKIERLHYYPQFAGPYETGWRDVDADQKIVPYHYTSVQAGSPVPPFAEDASLPQLKGDPKLSLHALDLRITAMDDEDKIRNLQNAYGYYIDQKMWDDVVDLFTPDSVLEVAGVGIYDGPKGVRRALEMSGPAGLRHGELNDHLQLDMSVEIAPNGLEARARGLEWGMLGDADKGTAYWSLAVFENRYVKLNAVWRIREMRIFPIMKADYYQGWAKSHIVDPPPAAQFAPDRITPAADMAPDTVPDFLLDPVTDKSVSYPDGMKPIAQDSLLPAWVQIAPVDDRDISLGQARRLLSLSTAYDAVANVVGAFGYTIDDHRWHSLVGLFAQNGAREEPFSGFYIGHDHIAKAETMEWGPDPDSLTSVPPRTGIRSHLRMQPVILVAPDGRSATVRTRLLVWSTNFKSAGTLDTGMYPDDKLVLENGVWKLWNVAIDEMYWSSAGYKGGWAQVKDRPALSNPRPNKLLRIDPPDIPLTALGEREQGFGGGLGPSIDWPSIKPMWFAYRNPVSGRTPPHYWPECVTCVYQLSTSLQQNGY